MSEPAAAGTVATGDPHAPPRADFRDAVAWLVLGLATVVASIRMDRLEQQNINPLTIPGLLPGLLGVAMLLLGAVLALRSVQRGAFSRVVPPAHAMTRDELRRAWIAIALCVGYAVVLVGHGLPFWIASSIYVTASILVFRRISPDAQQRLMTAGAIVQSLVIGVSASVITWLVFERVFLVRLP